MVGAGGVYDGSYCTGRFHLVMNDSTHFVMIFGSDMTIDETRKVGR
jgi:hypothetical protein